MAYADYRFYTTTYYGDTVPESDFQKYAERASDRIDAITFDRLVNGFPEEERAATKVKKAVCAVAETLYQIDQIKKASMESVGTVTREDGTVVSKAVSSSLPVQKVFPMPPVLPAEQKVSTGRQQLIRKSKAYCCIR